MKNFFKQLRKNCISGALVLLPLIVFFLLLHKVWTFFQNYGEKVAHLLYLDTVFGPIGRDMIGGIFLITAFYYSGYLIRLTYLKKFSEWIDDKLMIFLPGYEKNRRIAEEKLNAKAKEPSPAVPILLKFGDYWQPAYLLEQAAGQASVFVPAAPFTNRGQIYIVSTDLIKVLPKTSKAELDNSIKSLGRGILNLK